MKGAIIPIIICMLALSVPPAEATLITIEITAEVDYVEDNGNYLEGQINPGDIITGTYTYDSSTPDTCSGPTVGDYWHYATPAGISLSVGGFNFRTNTLNTEFQMFIRNNTSSGNDIYGFMSHTNFSLPNSTQVDYIFWSLKDHTASTLSSDALPTPPPILDQWQENVLRIGTDRTFLIDAQVTSAVPEPASILLFALAGLFMRKRRN